MAIPMIQYVTNDVYVDAGVITESNLGEVVQKLFDGSTNKSFSVSVTKNVVNPLVSEPSYNVIIMGYYLGKTFVAKIGDYIVVEQVVVGYEEDELPIYEQHVYAMDKVEFESKFSVVESFI